MLVGKKSSIFRKMMCTVGSAKPEIPNKVCNNGKNNELI